MANHDHPDTIGTHPAYSWDHETRLRARLDAAQRNKARFDAAYTAARNDLRVFLAEKSADAADEAAEVAREDYR